MHDMTFCCVISTPFGRPVVPDEQKIKQVWFLMSTGFEMKSFRSNDEFSYFVTSAGSDSTNLSDKSAPSIRITFRTNFRFLQTATIFSATVIVTKTSLGCERLSACFSSPGKRFFQNRYQQSPRYHDRLNYLTFGVCDVYWCDDRVKQQSAEGDGIVSVSVVAQDGYHFVFSQTGSVQCFGHVDTFFQNFAESPSFLSFAVDLKNILNEK